jgi:hypothetical protein
MPMTFGRPLRRWLSACTVFALLFMQIATSAYACPLIAASSVPAEAMPCAGMMADASAPSGIDQMAQTDQPSLCIKHCQADPQGVDEGHAPVLSAPALVTMLALVPAGEATGDTPIPPGAQAEQRATPPPPIAVLNCCWRI